MRLFITLQVAFCVIYVLLGLLDTGYSLVGYSCSGKGTITMRVDLSSPEECDEPEQFYQKPEEITMQLMAIDVDREIKGYRCEVMVTAEVTRCGFDSIVYGSNTPLVDHPVKVDAVQCWKMVKEGVYNYWGETFEVKVAANQVRQFYSRGGRDVNGYCETEEFTTAGIRFTKHYEQRTLRISVEKTSGYYDKRTDNAIIQGVRAPYAGGSFVDSKLGTVVWKPREPKCHESVSQIYLGKAHIHRHRNGTLGSFIMLANNRTNQYGGYRLMRTTSVCNVQGFETQEEGLVIRILRNGDEPLAHTKFRNSAKFTELNLLSKMTYLHLKTNTASELQFSLVYDELCGARRRTTLNSMRMVAFTNNHYIALDLFGPGHTIYSRGAVAYVTKCNAEVAKIRAMDNCTLDIPVSYGQNFSKSGFLDPISFIIKSHSHILPCDPINPVSWNIDGQWWCSGPELRACPTPSKIEVATETSHMLRDYAAEIAVDMFTDAQHEAHEAYILAQNSREPVLTELAFKSSMNGKLGDPAGIPITDEELFAMSLLIGMEISPAFYFFGKTYFIIFVLIHAYGVLKIIFDALTRVYIALKTKPCGWDVIKVLLHSSFLFLMFPVHVMEAAAGLALGNRGDDDDSGSRGGLNDNRGADRRSTTDGDCDNKKDDRASNKYETPPRYGKGGGCSITRGSKSGANPEECSMV